jgi:hypothetical protein
LSPPTITSNRYASLSAEGSEDLPTPTGSVTIPKPPPIYIQNVTSPPHLIQLLNQTPINNTSSQPLPIIRYGYNKQLLIHTGQLLMPSQKTAEFHTFKPKEERNYARTTPLTQTSKLRLKNLDTGSQMFGISHNTGQSYHSLCFL